MAALGLPLVAVVAIAISLCGTLAMMAFSVVYADEPGTQFWAPAYMLETVGTITLVVRAPADDPVTTMSGSVCFVLGYLLLWAGYLRFFNRRPPWLPAMAVMIAYLAALVWSVIVMPHPDLRAGATMLTIALLTGLTCYSVLRYMQVELLQSQALIALLFGLLTVGSLARGLLGMSGRLPGAGFTDGPLGYGIYLVTATMWLLLATCTGMMLVRRRRLSVPASDAAPPPPHQAPPSAAGAPPPR